MAMPPAAFAVGLLSTSPSEQLDSRLGTIGPIIDIERNSLRLSAKGMDDCTFTVYSIVGNVVATVKVKAGDTESLELKSGCYVVRCGHWSKKVIVS
ncbi:MAG: hypothetical protein NC131_19530 [Roseburia sp.]|nr:hypothetical protein [Roseburia sp.]